MSVSKMDGMKPRLLQDFIIPHLEQGTFGDKLCWIDRSNRKFRITWKHQSSSRFSPEDSLVFQEWAIAKGLWNPHEQKCHTKAKQRLRAALLKLKSVKCIAKDAESRVYAIISPRDDATTPFQQILTENRPIQYQTTATVDFPMDFFEEYEDEIFMNQLLDISSDFLQEN